jgi:hypothetical protein
MFKQSPIGIQRLYGEFTHKKQKVSLLVIYDKNYGHVHVGKQV